MLKVVYFRAFIFARQFVSAWARVGTLRRAVSGRVPGSHSNRAICSDCRCNPCLLHARPAGSRRAAICCFSAAAQKKLRWLIDWINSEKLERLFRPDSGAAEYCYERVCLCVCLSVLDHYLRNYTSELHQILRMLPTAAARSFCGGVMTRDVFPVLWMTSYLHISWCCSKSPPGWGSEAHTQPWAWRVGIHVAGSGLSGLLLAVRA